MQGGATELEQSTPRVGSARSRSLSPKRKRSSRGPAPPPPPNPPEALKQGETPPLRIHSDTVSVLTAQKDVASLPSPSPLPLPLQAPPTPPPPEHPPTICIGTPFATVVTALHAATASEKVLLTKVKLALYSANFGVLLDLLAMAASTSSLSQVTRVKFVATLSVLGDQFEEGVSLLFNQISASASFTTEQDSLPLAVIVSALAMATSSDITVISDHVFACFDTNGDGTLTLSELRSFLKVALAYRIIDRAPPRSVDETTTPEEHSANLLKSEVFASALAKRTFNDIDIDHR